MVFNWDGFNLYLIAVGLILSIYRRKDIVEFKYAENRDLVHVDKDSDEVANGVMAYCMWFQKLRSCEERLIEQVLRFAF